VLAGAGRAAGTTGGRGVDELLPEDRGWCAALAAASLAAAAARATVFAIGTRVAAGDCALPRPDPAASGRAVGAGRVAVRGGVAAVGGVGGGTGEVSISSMTGSSSTSSSGAGCSTGAAAGGAIGTALEGSSGARNSSGSMKWRSVCSKSFTGAAAAVAGAGTRAAGASVGGSLGGAVASSGSSRGRSGRSSSDGRDAASIWTSKQRASGAASRWLTDREALPRVRDAGLTYRGDAASMRNASRRFSSPSR
jgi:hypothetical protein